MPQTVSADSMAIDYLSLVTLLFVQYSLTLRVQVWYYIKISNNQCWKSIFCANVHSKVFFNVILCLTNHPCG